VVTFSLPSFRRVSSCGTELRHGYRWAPALGSPALGLEEHAAGTSRRGAAPRSPSRGVSLLLVPGGGRRVKPRRVATSWLAAKKLEREAGPVLRRLLGKRGLTSATAVSYQY